MPSLSPTDRDLLTTFIRHDFHHAEFASHIQMPLDEAIQWASRPDIQSWLAAHDALRERNIRAHHDDTLNFALSALESIIIDCQKQPDPNPAEVRRAAFGIIRAIRLARSPAARPVPPTSPPRSTKTQGSQSLGPAQTPTRDAAPPAAPATSEHPPSPEPPDLAALARDLLARPPSSHIALSAPLDNPHDPDTDIDDALDDAEDELDDALDDENDDLEDDFDDLDEDGIDDVPGDPGAFPVSPSVASSLASTTGPAP